MDLRCWSLGGGMAPNSSMICTYWIWRLWHGRSPNAQVQPHHLGRGIRRFRWGQVWSSRVGSALMRKSSCRLTSQLVILSMVVTWLNATSMIYGYSTRITSFGVGWGSVVHPQSLAMAIPPTSLGLILWCLGGGPLTLELEGTMIINKILI